MKKSDTSSLRVNGRHVIVCKDPTHGWAWRQIRPVTTAWFDCKTKAATLLAAEVYMSAMEEH